MWFHVPARCHLKQNVFLELSMAAKFISSYRLDANIAYVRIDHKGTKYFLHFRLDDFVNSIHRDFNFCRRLTETLADSVSRIETNLKNASKTDKKEITVQFFKNQKLIENLNEIKCKQIFETKNNRDEFEMRIADHSFKLLLNSPWIEKCSLPELMLANCVQYPRKVIAYNFIENDQSQFSWFRSKNLNLKMIEWELLKTGSALYCPTIADIGYYLQLRVTPKVSVETGSDRLSCGSEFFFCSKKPVQKAPLTFPFEQRHKFTSHALEDSNSFRIISYNILAPNYTSTEYSKTVLFTYCPAHALESNYRKQLIVKELLGYNGDIICLQEVDYNVFETDLKPIFSMMNFDGLFAQKFSKVSEGSACFYRKTRFQLLESKKVSYIEELKKHNFENLDGDDDLKLALEQAKNCLQIVTLQSRQSKDIIMVANTHLYFHPEADSFRFLQSLLALDVLEQEKRKFEKKFLRKVAVVFCGDFNTTPDCAIYDFYTNGKVSNKTADWKEKYLLFERKILKSNSTIRFESACGTPPFTHYTIGFSGCLDYMFLEKFRFEIQQVVPFLSEDQLKEHVAIPSEVHPSDHMALVVDLSLVSEH